MASFLQRLFKRKDAEIPPSPLDTFPEIGFGTVTLMTSGVHAFLIIQSCEERLDPTTNQIYLHRIVRRAEFCPARNIDSICGRGVCKLQENTDELKSYLDACKFYPSWTRPMEDIDRILDQIRTQTEGGSLEGEDIYSSTGDSITILFGSEKVKLHSCISWCEKVLVSIDIKIPSTHKFYLLKFPPLIIWRMRKENNQTEY